MQRTGSKVTRRTVLRSLAALGGAATVGSRPLVAQVQAGPGPMLTRAIPATGEQVPVIGMGSWITFNVGEDRALRDQRAQVLQTFFERGGAVIDS